MRRFGSGVGCSATGSVCWYIVAPPLNGNDPGMREAVDRFPRTGIVGSAND
jgi:hypothetical protein